MPPGRGGGHSPMTLDPPLLGARRSVICIAKTGQGGMSKSAQKALHPLLRSARSALRKQPSASSNCSTVPAIRGDLLGFAVRGTNKKRLLAWDSHPDILSEDSTQEAHSDGQAPRFR